MSQLYVTELTQTLSEHANIVKLCLKMAIPILPKFPVVGRFRGYPQNPQQFLIIDWQGKGLLNRIW